MEGGGGGGVGGGGGGGGGGGYSGVKVTKIIKRGQNQNPREKSCLCIKYLRIPRKAKKSLHQTLML